MDRIAKIRSEEKKYHDACYDTYNLFEPGSWLYKPVKTVIDLLAKFEDQDDISVLDLGCGIGRNSIPMAQALKNRNSKVVCVDLLESAIHKLHSYSHDYGVEHYVETRLSDIEHFAIGEEEYDIIVAVSSLEHVSSEIVLERKLREMVRGTRLNGSNCIVIGSNIREVQIENGEELDPMFEVNLPTERMMGLLDQMYADWTIEERLVKPLEYEIERNRQPVYLTTDCITFVARRTKQLTED